MLLLLLESVDTPVLSSLDGLIFHTLCLHHLSQLIGCLLAVSAVVCAANSERLSETKGVFSHTHRPHGDKLPLWVHGSYYSWHHRLTHSHTAF